jgi:hypothetical protein
MHLPCASSVRTSPGWAPPHSLPSPSTPPSPDPPVLQFSRHRRSCQCNPHTCALHATARRMLESQRVCTGRSGCSLRCRAECSEPPSHRVMHRQHGHTHTHTLSLSLSLSLFLLQLSDTQRCTSERAVTPANDGFGKRQRCSGHTTPASGVKRPTNRPPALHALAPHDGAVPAAPASTPR